MNINDFGRNSFVTHITGFIERIEKTTEHLSKLKKDGKTVGYCKLLKYHDPLDLSRHWKGWGYSRNGKNWGQYRIDFDTAHRFVTKNKNDKDVFVDDKVKANGIIAIVKWDARECRYMLSTIPSLCEYPPALYDNMGSKFLWSDIELIKDKEDE